MGSSKESKNEIESIHVAKKHELGIDIHNKFMDSMENRFSEMISFLSVLLPVFGGLLLVLARTKLLGENILNPMTLFASILIILFLLIWGGSVTFSLAYRYRYLQACVYYIEEKIGADEYIPDKFKPTRLDKKEKIYLSIAPDMLQTNIYFFLLGIIGLPILYVLLIEGFNIYGILLIIVCLMCLFYIFYLGAYHYPKKLNNIIEYFRPED